jgi:hypothetical protein
LSLGLLAWDVENDEESSRGGIEAEKEEVS